MKEYILLFLFILALITFGWPDEDDNSYVGMFEGEEVILITNDYNDCKWAVKYTFDSNTYRLIRHPNPECVPFNKNEVNNYEY